MDKKLLKKLLIFSILLLIIIMIMLAVMNYINKQKLAEMNNEDNGYNFIENYGTSKNGGIDYQSYFDIKMYMQKFLNNININNSQYKTYDIYGNSVQLLQENEIKQKILNLLSNKYINEKNITIDNLYEHVKVLEEKTMYVPLETILVYDGEIKSFLTHGLIEKRKDYTVVDELYAIVNINLKAGNFSIEPIYGNYNNINEINIEKLEDTILPNDDNEWNTLYATTEEIPTEYINIYQCLALGAPEKLYELLDEEYRNSKFGSLDEFKNYIQKRKTKIKNCRLEEYKRSVIDDKVVYICIDQYENYYIISENQTLLDFDIMLDTYTIDINEFIEKYNSSDNDVKVALNIEKMIDAIQDKDYKFVYNKLNETFKNNNFKTQEDFEYFLQERFDPNEDEVSYKQYKEVAGLHTLEIEVTDADMQTTKKAEILMQLKENRDFVFSFSAEN